MNWKSYIPFFEWWPGYGQNQLKGDLTAGLTVGIMLIPQGMAYSLLAGLPPIYGLYASTIPLILYAIFGTSRQLAVGPVAMVALLIATGVGNIAETGSENFIALAILLALMVGAIQLLLGMFRLGFLVNFLSHPVISGFTSAAALIIGLSQLKHLLGIEIDRSNFIHEILINAYQHISEVHIGTLLIGLAGIVIIILLKKWKPSFPGPLVAVVLGILVVYGFNLAPGGVKILQEVPEGLPAFALPNVNLANIQALLPTALTIALVGFMESIAVAKAIQARHKNYQVRSNQELIGLGLANLGGALFQSFPTTGGFSRTAVNDQAGAKTGMASIFSALLIGLTLLFLTPLFYFLPKAILASIIMVAVFGLIDFKEAKHLWKTDRVDFAMLAATFVATLGLGIEQGILIGVVLSLGMVIYRSAYPHVAFLGKVEGTSYYRNISRFPKVKQRDDIFVMRFDAPLFFANTDYFRDKLENMAKQKGQDLKLVVLNAEAMPNLDSTAVHALKDILEDFRTKGIRIYIAAAIGPVRDVMFKTGLIQKLGKDALFMHVDDAIKHYDQLESIEQATIDPRALQTNIAKEAGPFWD